MKASQKDIILRHLKRGWWLSLPKSIDKYRIVALSQRIGELRKEGHDIISVRVHGKPYHRYKLIKSAG